MSYIARKRNCPFSDENSMNGGDNSLHNSEDGSFKEKIHSKESQLYLNYNRDTPLDPGVLQTVVNTIVNPKIGEVKNSIEESRENIASMIAGEIDEIIFTSSSIESLFITVKSAKDAFHEWFEEKFPDIVEVRAHMISTTVESIDALNFLQAYTHENGIDFTLVPVSMTSGYVSLENVLKAIKPGTCLITLPHVISVTGIIQPLKDIFLCLQEIEANPMFYRPLFHSDISNALGKMRVDVKRLGLDYATISGDKIYAPKICALYIDQEFLRPKPFCLKTSLQEEKMRTGLIVGFGHAALLILHNLKRYKNHFSRLRKYFEEELINRLGENVTIWRRDETICNVTCVSFSNSEAFGCLEKRDILCSNIKSARLDGVVTALMESGLTADLAKQTLSISFGRFTTDDELTNLVKRIVKALSLT